MSCSGTQVACFTEKCVTELQQSCNRAATELCVVCLAQVLRLLALLSSVLQSCNISATDLQQSCNRGMRSMSCSGTQITCFTSTKVQILTNTELQQSYMQQSTMRRIAIFGKSYMLQQRCCSAVAAPLSRSCLFVYDTTTATIYYAYSSVAAPLQHLYREAVGFSPSLCPFAALLAELLAPLHTLPYPFLESK